MLFEVLWLFQLLVCLVGLDDELEDPPIDGLEEGLEEEGRVYSFFTGRLLMVSFSVL